MRGVRQAGKVHKPGTHRTPCRRPLLDYYLALGWLAQAEIKLVKRRGKPDARRYGGDRHRINWAAGHGDSQGIGRAGQGLEMHWMEVTLAVTNRCSSLPVVSRRPCHAVSVWLSCSAPNAAIEPHCTALQRTHMQVNGGERSIAADEWMDGPASASELHGSRLGCVESLLRCGLSRTFLGMQQSGTRKPKKGARLGASVSQSHRCRIVTAAGQGGRSIDRREKTVT